MGLHQALAHLREDAYVRPVRETLAKYAGRPAEDIKGLQAELVEKLLDEAYLEKKG